MQLSLTFSALLASVLAVQAAPVAQPRMVTLPLKRMEHRSGAHPQILLQQHINRGSKRLARMTGREVPSDEVLHEALRKRVVAVEGEAGLQRRYNRVGVPSFTSSGKSKAKGGNDLVELQSNVVSDIGGADSANGVQIANTPSTSNSLGLDIETPDLGYLATVQMGTPPKDYLLLMDSGSADLWVPGELCTTCGNHQTLGTTSSSTFVPTTGEFTTTYGSGSVNGTIVRDNLVVAGLQLPGHTFGVTSGETAQFSADTVPFDGLMGLAQSALAQQRVPTPVEALASAGLIKSAITSYKLSREADELNDGEITFGALDTTKFDPSTLTILDNVNTGGFWEADMDSVTVDGTDIGISGLSAVLDTGTTLIIAPAASAQAVHELIDGAQPDGNGGFTIPCTFNQTVSLTFGGNAFDIDSRDMVGAPVDATDPTGACTSGIVSGSFGNGETEWLVGDVFLKNAYYSTDVGQNTVSLAKLV